MGDKSRKLPRAWVASIGTISIGTVSIGNLGCSDRELCVPNQSSFGFFSKGDCALTEASFFQGHEWLTYFGNRDLPEAERF